MPEIESNAIEVTRDEGKTYQVPYWGVNSAVDGPCLLVTSALHANELQGAEVLYRLLPLLQAELLCGRCLLVPFASPWALHCREPHMDLRPGHYYGRDRVNNVNATWPGKADGSNAERLSHALFHGLVEQVTHGLDIHCWQDGMASTALPCAGHEGSLRLAEVAALPFARPVEWFPEIERRPVVPCILTRYLNDTGRTALTVELCGQYGFREPEVARGARALRNILRELRMLPGSVEAPQTPTLWLDRCEQVEVRAEQAGVFVPRPFRPGDSVEAGTLLGHILVDATLEKVDVKSPCAGCLYQFGAIHRHNPDDPASTSSEFTMKFVHPYVEADEVLAVVVSTQCVACDVSAAICLGFAVDVGDNRHAVPVYVKPGDLNGRPLAETRSGWCVCAAGA